MKVNRLILLSHYSSQTTTKLILSNTLTRMENLEILDAMSTPGIVTYATLEELEKM